MTYIFDAPSSSLQHSHLRCIRNDGGSVGWCGMCVCIYERVFNIKLILVCRFGITSETGALSSRKKLRASDGPMFNMANYARFKQTLEYMNNEKWAHNAISTLHRHKHHTLTYTITAQFKFTMNAGV